MDVPTLAELLRETAEHHDHYEKTHAEHHWWDWYAPYLSARQDGSSPEEAAAAVDRYMEEVLHIFLPDDGSIGRTLRVRRSKCSIQIGNGIPLERDKCSQELKMIVAAFLPLRPLPLPQPSSA